MKSKIVLTTDSTLTFLSGIIIYNSDLLIVIAIISLVSILGYHSSHANFIRC